ncbi:MAG TPA: sensor histidine kinase, partial [Micromonosporaceae bacterium]|nr:sensor histidine kinase [Micromonosporaceae bacterium]
MVAHPRWTFTRQMLALHLTLTGLVVTVTMAMSGWLLSSWLDDQYGARALATARAVAVDPAIASAAAKGDTDRVIQGRAEAIRGATRALFVVVTDRDGIRFSHPNPAMIGRRVSTDPSVALAGREVVVTERGTLGWSVRAKVPLRHDGAVIGAVSVGYAMDEITSHRNRLLVNYGGVSAGAFVIATWATLLLARRLRQLTLGREPHEVAELLRAKEAVIYGISDGVIAVDLDGRITMCNREAARLLGTAPPAGTPLAELGLPHVPEGRGSVIVFGEQVLVAQRRRVRSDGEDLGTVITLKDRTELETLTQELDSVRALTDALRAQQHEFSNRVHTIAGLIETGHFDEATNYIHQITPGSVIPLGPSGATLRDPYLQAFLMAKSAQATERGMIISVGEGSFVPSPVTAPIEVTTVVGNLLDNALDSARLGSTRPARVDIDLVADGDVLHVVVADSGLGVP